MKASCCPDALESDAVASTLPCWWRNQVFDILAFDLILDSNKILLLAIFGLNSVDTITRECLPQMGEGGEKVLGNV